mmetsp:Transcript_3632/g.10239  ORF Transcript_3632/g.10239 Transcript_3632/m.10239 type:complete len:322 (+) Transcript_3632:471-1436(+)
MLRLEPHCQKTTTRTTSPRFSMPTVDCNPFIHSHSRCIHASIRSILSTSLSPQQQFGSPHTHQDARCIAHRASQQGRQDKGPQTNARGSPQQIVSRRKGKERGQPQPDQRQKDGGFVRGLLLATGDSTAVLILALSLARRGLVVVLVLVVVALAEHGGPKIPKPAASIGSEGLPRGPEPVRVRAGEPPGGGEGQDPRQGLPQNADRKGRRTVPSAQRDGEWLARDEGNHVRGRHQGDRRQDGAGVVQQRESSRGVDVSVGAEVGVGAKVDVKVAFGVVGGGGEGGGHQFGSSRRRFRDPQGRISDDLLVVVGCVGRNGHGG